MKNIFFIICLCFCGLCYSQEKQRIFLRFDKDLSYEPALIDKTLKQILQIDKQTTFKVYKEEDIKNVDIYDKQLRLYQYFGEYRLIEADVGVLIKDNKILDINGFYYSSVGIVKKTTLLMESEILQIVGKEVFASKTNYEPQYKIEKVISKNYYDDDDKRLYYAYMVVVSDKNDIETCVEIVIDENSGKILRKTSLVRHAIGTAVTRYNGTREIETTQITNPVSTKYVLRDLTRGNGIFTRNLNHGTNIFDYTEFSDADNNWMASEYHNSNKDDGALDAHWAAMKTYDYFYNKHQRNSYDDAGGVINCYIHFKTNEENASWNPNSKVFLFGDGYTDFDMYTSLDIVAHEIGHAVCDYSAKLIYSGESGAICEGLSDIWGACVENYCGTNKQTWLCGEDIDMRTGHVALRSMRNPKEEDQPDTYGGTYWVQTSGCFPSEVNDYCGVHTNSGVLNHWFYLLSEGGSGTNDLGNTYNVIGIGIEDAAKIVYRAETKYLRPSSDFLHMRECTINAATVLYPNNSFYAKSVANAWYAVGLGDCQQYVLSNQTITTNRNINECSVEVHNVTIGSNASLNINFQQEAVLSHDVEIQVGSTLNIQ